MKRTIAVLALALAGCSAPDSTAITAPTLGAVSVFTNGVYLVRLRDDTPNPDAVAQSLSSAHGGQVRRVYRYAIKGFAAELPDAAVEALERNPSVVSVEPNGVTQAFETQSNPPAWGIDRIDQRFLPLDRAYTYANAGAGVHVYIIDTGIHPAHQEFGGRVTMDGGDFSGSLDGWGVGDCNGHGTHVAGIVGGQTTGVAKAVRLHGIRVLGCSGGGMWDGFLAGIDYVVGNATRPAVISISLGGYWAPTMVNDAIEAAVTAGIPVVVAAGNSTAGLDACLISPGSAPNALTVMASTRDDQRAYFSNYGTCTDLYAPGAAILSSWSSPVNDPSNPDGSGGGRTCDTCYAVLSGTSMATPHVTGAVALLLAANPSLTPAQITALILGNATTGAIIANIANTPNQLLYVGTAGQEPPPPPPPPPSCVPRGKSGKCR